MTDDESDGKADVDLPDRLNRETGLIEWSDLARHFARGVVIRVETSVDLVDAAACLARDDTAQLTTWLASGELRRASDDDARDWNARSPRFWCVVTAPWVLVQECEPQRVVH